MISQFSKKACLLSVQQTMFKFLICPIQNGEYITPAGHFMPATLTQTPVSTAIQAPSNSNHQNSKDNITYIEPQTIELQRADGPNGSAPQQQQQQPQQQAGGAQEQQQMQGGHHAANQQQQQQAQNNVIRTSESEQHQQQYHQTQEIVPVSQSDLHGATSEPQQQQHPQGQVQFAPESPANSQSQEMSQTAADSNANVNSNHSPISTENDEN